MARKSIRTRLLFSLVPVFVLSLGILSGIGSHLASRTIQKGMKETASAIGKDSANRIKSTVELKVALLVELANTRRVRSTKKELVIDALTESQKRLPTLETIVFIALDGSGYRANGTTGQFGDRAYFKKILQEKKPCISDVVVSKGQGKLSVILAVPVLDEGQLKGVIAVAYTLEKMSNELRALRFKESGYVFVVDRHGILIENPNAPELTGKLNLSEKRIPRTLGLRQTELDDRLIALFRTAVNGETQVNGEYTFIDGVEHLAVFTPVTLVEDTKWVVIVTAPRKEATEDVQRLSEAFLLASLLCTILAVVSMVILSNRFTRPIQLLRDEYLRLAQGDFSEHTVHIPLQDEIGQLARSFHELRRNISHMMQELTARNRTLETEIRERKLAEEALEQYRDRLEDLVAERTAELLDAKTTADTANHAKSVFLANMSHELRTPLNAILGYSQLMQRASSLEPGQREYLHIINRSGEHLLELINDVLDLSKIESGRITFSPHTFDLPAMLQDLHSMFKMRTEAKGITFERDMDRALPRYVVTDENKFRQVLINLLGNAVKFTDTGGIVLRVRRNNATPENTNSHLVVEVEDTGPGIKAEELDKVFQVFEQTAVGKSNRGGTGLGMAISREYARMMGGDITVTSREGAGSTFYFECCVREGNEADLRKKTQQHKVIGLTAGQPVPRILVVEDNEESRSLLVSLLTEVGFAVRTAENGEQAVVVASEWSPQFIWMDIRMPVMDGLEATRRIKATTDGESIKIVALTASALAEERESILSVGCDEVVHKPYRESAIFRVMAEQLGITYRYEQEEALGSVAPEPAISAQHLAALPENLRTALHQAVLALDMDSTLAVVADISRQNSVLGRMLHQLAENLEYDRLLSLLEGDEEKS